MTDSDGVMEHVLADARRDPQERSWVELTALLRNKLTHPRLILELARHGPVEPEMLRLAIASIDEVIRLVDPNYSLASGVIHDPGPGEAPSARRLSDP